MTNKPKGPAGADLIHRLEAADNWLDREVAVGITYWGNIEAVLCPNDRLSNYLRTQLHNVFKAGYTAGQEGPEVQALLRAERERCLFAIASIPTPQSEDIMHGHEDAYRAVKGLK